MPLCDFLIPGDLASPTGGYAYDRRLLSHLPPLGVDIRHVALPAGYPDPSAADLDATVAALATARPGAVVLIDGLALGAMPVDVLKTTGRPIVALCHHPLCLESGLDPLRAAELKSSEQAALALSAAVIVTSDETRGLLLRDFGVPASRISVAEPGTDPAPRAQGTGNPVQLLSVGSLVPRKGYGDLIEALSGVEDSDWQLTIAGSDRLHPSEPGRLRELIASHGLANRVSLTGALGAAELARLFRTADAFVMSSLYEGFGMVLTEALAHGLPIVTTRCGSAAARAPDAGAIKVEPGDVAALREALGRLVRDPGLRASMGKAAWITGQQLPRWCDTARTVAAVLGKVA